MEIIKNWKGKPGCFGADDRWRPIHRKGEKWMYGDSYTNITKKDVWIIGLLFVEMILGSILAIIFL